MILAWNSSARVCFQSSSVPLPIIVFRLHAVFMLLPYRRLLVRPSSVSIVVVRSTQMKTYHRRVRRYTIWSQCDSYTRVRSYDAYAYWVPTSTSATECLVSLSWVVEWNAWLLLDALGNAIVINIIFFFFRFIANFYLFPIEERIHSVGALKQMYIHFIVIHFVLNRWVWIWWCKTKNK